ncbi:MAG: preprotein translocase subunit SecG [Elusimicrobiota bacterium]
MYPIILGVHVLVCVLVILIVLIQAGRSGGFSGFLGAGGGDAIFSASSQQSGLRKLTVVLAGVFMLTSVLLTVLSSRREGRSVFDRPFATIPQFPASSDVSSQPSVPVPVDAENGTQPNVGN